jgi:AcrR family transcriptional regulator
MSLLNQHSVMSTSSTPTPPAANRFERRKERTHGDILRAAEQVMAHKGVHATTIADIAEAADVGVGTFYLHFGTKEALFDALVADTVERMKDAIDQARAGATNVIEEVEASTRALCRFASDNRQVFRVGFGHGSTYHEVVREAQEMFAADIENTIERGAAEGLFSDIDPALAAQAAIGMSTQLLAWWTEHDHVAIEALEQTLSVLTLNGLRRSQP